LLASVSDSAKIALQQNRQFKTLQATPENLRPLFRNQQVAGSIPAGGSKESINNKH
jgi:hypothetical protein